MPDASGQHLPQTPSGRGPVPAERGDRFSDLLGGGRGQRPRPNADIPAGLLAGAAAGEGDAQRDAFTFAAAHGNAAPVLTALAEKLTGDIAAARAEEARELCSSLLLGGVCNVWQLEPPRPAKHLPEKCRVLHIAPDGHRHPPEMLPDVDSLPATVTVCGLRLDDPPWRMHWTPAQFGHWATAGSGYAARLTHCETCAARAGEFSDCDEAPGRKSPLPVREYERFTAQLHSRVMGMLRDAADDGGALDDVRGAVAVEHRRLLVEWAAGRLDECGAHAPMGLLDPGRVPPMAAAAGELLRRHPSAWLAATGGVSGWVELLNTSYAAMERASVNHWALFAQTLHGGLLERLQQPV